MAQKKLKKGHKKAAIAAAAIIILAAAVLVLYINGASRQISQPSMPNTGQALPSAFSSVNLSDQAQVPAQLSHAILSQEANIAEASATYSGSVSGHAAGAGAIIPVSAQLQLSYSRIGGNVSIAANVTGIPLAGPIALQIRNTSSGAVLCSGLNFTAIQNGDFLAARSNSTECTPLSQYGISMQQLQYYNASLIRQEAAQRGVYINYTGIYQSSYRGQACTYIGGTISQPSKGGTGVFSLCLSDSTFLPLTSYSSFTNSQFAAYMLLNQT